MNAPNAYLMEVFGTEDVYRQKLAGALPLASRLLLAEANIERARRSELEEEYARMQTNAGILNARLREAARLRQSNEGFRSRVPVVLSVERTPGMLSGMDVPVGMDQGMVRLASVAGRMFAHVNIEDADFDFSKEAARSRLPRSGGTIRIKPPKTPGTPKIPKAPATVTSPAAMRTPSIGGASVSAPAASAGGVSPSAPKAVAGVSSTKPSAGAVSPPAPARAGAGNVSASTSPKQPAGPYKTPDSPAEPTGGQGQGPKPPPAAQSAGQVQPPPQSPAASTQPPQGQVQGPQSPPAAQQAQPGTSSAGEVGSPEAAAKQTADAEKKKPGFLERAKLTDAQGNLDFGKIKNTALGLGIAGLGSYGLYRAGTGLINAYSQESGPMRLNANSAQPAGGVNEYGYADRSVPYM